MKRHNVASGVRTVAANHGLLRALTLREIEVRYRGSVLGILWAAVYPITMLALYTFVFGVIYKARWPGFSALPDFVLMVYCGLVTYTLMAETLSRAPSAIVSQPNYVKKVVFPLELLPMSHLGVALFNAAIGFVILSAFFVLEKRYLPISVLAVPIVLAPLTVMLAGFAWFIASIGVFFRDVSQLIGVLTTMLMMLSPVFYPASSAPDFAQFIIAVNPLTYPIEEVRRVLVLGSWPDWWMWLGYTAVALPIAGSGLWVFQKTRPAFGDVV